MLDDRKINRENQQNDRRELQQSAHEIRAHRSLLARPGIFGEVARPRTHVVDVTAIRVRVFRFVQPKVRQIGHENFLQFGVGGHALVAIRFRDAAREQFIHLGVFVRRTVREQDRFDVRRIVRAPHANLRVGTVAVPMHNPGQTRA